MSEDRRTAAGGRGPDGAGITVPAESLTEEEREQRERELAAALDSGGLDELPPNVPPGLLGEVAPDLRKVDEHGSHGLNAGLTDEWTMQTTVMAAVLALLLFFPAAYYIVWRSRLISTRHKVTLYVAMTGFLVLAAVRLLGWN